jgi:hypothetical protein
MKKLGFNAHSDIELIPQWRHTILVSRERIMRNLTSFFLLFLVHTGIAQTTFSRWYAGMNMQGAGESTYVCGDIPQGYVGIAVTKAESGTYTAQTVTIVDKTTGDVLKYFTVDSVDARGMLYIPEDSTLILYGSCRINGAVTPRALRVDLNGNVIWSHTYPYPRSIVFGRAVITHKKELLLIGDASGTNAQMDGKIAITKIDLQGNKLWTRTIGKKFANYIPDGFDYWTDTTYRVIALAQFARLATPIPFPQCHYGEYITDGDYTAIIDDEANVLEDTCLYMNDEFTNLSTKHFAKLPGKRFVMQREEAYSQQQCNLSNKIVCFDSAYNRLWAYPVLWGATTGSSYNGGFGCFKDKRNNVLAHMESVAAPVVFYPNGQQAEKGPDNLYYLKGETGELIWHKKFMAYGVEGPVWPSISQARPTEDGGFFMTGLYDDDTGPHQRWYIKLDSNGCLIPGCGLDTYWIAPIPTSVNETEIPQASYFSPNPVQSIMRFQLPDGNESGYFIISNVSGQFQAIKHFQQGVGELDLSGLPQGTYLIAVYSDDKQLVGWQKVLKVE